MTRTPRARLASLLAAALLLAGGCATTGARGDYSSASVDPYERWNRKVYALNDTLDVNVLKPVATAYTKAVPQPVRTGVGNFLGNFADVWSAFNNLLQGKFGPALLDVVRVGTNTVFGVFGVFDVATEAGIDRQGEDFGQTLGRWGFGAGPYIVWPLLGPSNLRDSFALPLDRGWSPALAFDDAASYAITGLSLVNTRASLLSTSRMLDDIALDKYIFVRDAYLQRRRSLVLDGAEPPEEDDPAESVAPAASAPGSPK